MLVCLTTRCLHRFSGSISEVPRAVFSHVPQFVQKGKGDPLDCRSALHCLFHVEIQFA
jgi:hypothetical protein